MLIYEPTETALRLDVAHALLQFLQLFLEGGMFLGHVLVLLFPLISRLLKSLNFALEVASLDVR